MQKEKIRLKEDTLRIVKEEKGEAVLLTNKIRSYIIQELFLSRQRAILGAYARKRSIGFSDEEFELVKNWRIKQEKDYDEYFRIGL